MVVRILASVALAGLLGAAACGCWDGTGIAEVRPGTDRTVRVGDSFVAEYFEGSSCDHSLQKQYLLWWTRDSSIVRVDSLLGTVTALAVGDGDVWASHPDLPANYDTRALSIAVHVR